MKHQIKILAACLLFVALGLLGLWLFAPRVVEDQSLGEVFSRAIRDSGLHENAPLTEAGSQDCASLLKARISNYVVQNRGFKKGDFYSLWDRTASGDNIEKAVVHSYILSLLYFPQDGQEELHYACVQDSFRFFKDYPEGFRSWVECLFFQVCFRNVVVLNLQYLRSSAEIYMVNEYGSLINEINSVQRSGQGDLYCPAEVLSMHTFFSLCEFDRNEELRKALTNKDFSILNRCLDEFKEEVLLNEFEIAVFDLDRLRILRVSDWTSAINVCTITTAKMTPGVPLINVRIPVIDFAANKTLVLDVPSDVYAEISSFYSGKIAPEDFVRSLSDVIDAQEINAQIPPEFFRIQSH